MIWRTIEIKKKKKSTVICKLKSQDVSRAWVQKIACKPWCREDISPGKLFSLQDSHFQEKSMFKRSDTKYYPGLMKYFIISESEMFLKRQ